MKLKVTGKCDCCGKFRKDSELVYMQAEGDEIWLECRYCMSPVDEERYFKRHEDKNNELN